MTLPIFNELNEEPPPSTVDIDAIFARERRAGRRRRLAGAGMAGLLVAGLGVGVAAYAGNAGPGPGTQVAATPSQRAAWSAAQVATIERELRDVVLRVAPGAQLSNIGRLDWGPYDDSKKPARSDGVLDGERYSMTAIVTLHGSRGRVSIQIHRRFDQSGGLHGCEGYFGTCEATTTPEGRPMVIDKQAVQSGFGPNPDVSYYVIVDRGDGVFVAATHGNAIGGAGPNTAPPLTVEQLKQIALDPALVPTS